MHLFLRQLIPNFLKTLKHVEVFPCHPRCREIGDKCECEMCVIRPGQLEWPALIKQRWLRRDGRMDGRAAGTNVQSLPTVVLG